MRDTSFPPHHRRSIRLQGYNYSSSEVYFVTIVTRNRLPIFGSISGDEMYHNENGLIVWEEWLRSAHIRAEIELDEFVIMPNHFHAIFIINSDEPAVIDSIAANGNLIGTNGHLVGANGRSPLQRPAMTKRSVGSLMAGFKSSVTKRINILRNTPGQPIWQRNYYEHIIGTEHEYEEIANYIHDNPLNWQINKENQLHK